MAQHTSYPTEHLGNVQVKRESGICELALIVLIFFHTTFFHRQTRSTVTRQIIIAMFYCSHEIILWLHLAKLLYVLSFVLPILLNVEKL